MKALLLAAVAALTCALPSLAQTEVPVRTEDLGSGIYALSTDRAGNIGILVGEDGIFMVDTQMAPFAPSIDQPIKAVAEGEDVDLILNTHLQGDHVLGNKYFAERGAVIMANPNVRPALIAPQTSQLTGRMPDPLSGLMLPTVNVGEGDFVTMNGQTVRFYHVPTAHTDGDIFVMFEEANVMHAGDMLFSGWFPYIDLDNGGTVQGYIDGLKRMIEVADEDTVVIAGHGPLSTVADLQASADMLTEGKARIEELVKAGLSLEDIQAEQPLADFHDAWNWRFITTERMVWTFYRDLTGKTE